ncbi:MAG: Spx/MgsR family RNA polymerase-binding regulatory protein [Prosthecobacter sp.]|jgi:arsenate reductase
MKVYAYQGCSTCRKALSWLKSHGLEAEVLPIRETPPSLAELRAALKARGGDLRALFNTSGLDYRAMDIKSKLPGLSVEEALTLLSTHGNLVKRPLLADAKAGIHLVGFQEAEWEKALG